MIVDHAAYCLHHLEDAITRETQICVVTSAVLNVFEINVSHQMTSTTRNYGTQIESQRFFLASQNLDAGWSLATTVSLPSMMWTRPYWFRGFHREATFKERANE